MLENNFGNRIWLSRACEGWDGAYFNLVETTKCGRVRNGEKKKTKTNKQEKAEKNSGERDDDLLSIDMSIDMVMTSIFEQISLRFIFNSPFFYSSS
jgi:hypothetical protein